MGGEGNAMGFVLCGEERRVGRWVGGKCGRWPPNTTLALGLGRASTTAGARIPPVARGASTTATKHECRSKDSVRDGRVRYFAPPACGRRSSKILWPLIFFLRQSVGVFASGVTS